MKKLLAASATSFATAASAHEGAHMHPHGMESAWGYALMALVIGTAALLALRALRS